MRKTKRKEKAMKTIELKTGSLEVPTTVDDWQLYSGVKGSSTAARAMTASLVRTIKAFGKIIKNRTGATLAVTKDEIIKALAEAFYDNLDKTMSKHGDQGAWDTEPRYVGKDAFLQGASLLLYGNKNTLRKGHGLDTGSF